MTQFDNGDLLRKMKETSRGWRCQPCFLYKGRIQQARSDGQPLSELDRCAGCGETVCDRHKFGPTRDAHPNGLQQHYLLLESKPRTVVEEVPNKSS